MILIDHHYHSNLRSNPTVGNKVIKCALINCPSNNVLYSLLPLASLMGEISDLVISTTSCINSSLICLPLRKADDFGRYIGTGPTPPADIPALSMILPFIPMLIA